MVDLINGKKISENHDRRSQKPSRDIVPIKNRQRPAAVSGSGSGSESAEAPPARRPPIRRPAPNSGKPATTAPSASVVAGAAVSPPSSVGKRAWGAADDDKAIVASSRADAHSPVDDSSKDAVGSPNAAAGWGSTVKGWFGLGNPATTERAVETAAASALPKDVEIPASVSLPVDKESESQIVRKRRTLPSTVGPPVDEISGSVKESVAPTAQKRDPVTPTTARKVSAELEPANKPTSKSNGSGTTTLQEAMAKKSAVDKPSEEARSGTKKE